MHLFLRSILTFLATSIAASAIGAAQTVYAVVLGNQKYVVGSSTLHSGLFISRDTGASWTHLGPQNLKAYAMDAVDSARGRILFIAAGNGVHKSTDYGGSWRITSGWEMTEVMDVRVDQRDPRYIYAATAFGLWRSTDGGESWEHPPSIVHDVYSYRIDLFDDLLLLSGEDAIYASTDRGATWRRSGPIPGPRGVFQLRDYRVVPTGNGPYILVIGPDTIRAFPTFSPKLRTAVYGVAHNNWRNYTVGENGVWSEMVQAKEPYWQDITGELPTRAVHAVTMVGNELLIGTFGEGTFRLQRGAWVRSGLEGSQIWSMKVKEW